MQETIENNKNKYKIAIISPAPFYYHVPLYRSLTDSPDIDLKVYYCSDEVLRGKDIEKTYLVKGRISDAVSYTHLTLPTNREV